MTNDSSIPPGYKRCTSGDDCKHPEGPVLPETVEYFASRGSARPGQFFSKCKKCMAHKKQQWRRHKGVEPRNFPTPDGKKRCPDCGELKPLTSKYFRKHTHSKSGFRSKCIDCDRKADEQKRRTCGVKPKVRTTQDMADEKLCKYCNKVKPLYEFSYSSSGKYQRMHICKKCEADKRGWQYRPHVPERYKFCPRCAQIKSLSKFNKCKANPPSGLQWCCRECQRSYGIVRKSKSRVKEGVFTETQWNSALEYFGHSCAVCGKSPDLFTVLHLDHWIPITSDDYPGHIATNIVPLCAHRHYTPAKNGETPGCNQSKGNLMPEEWLASRFDKREAKRILEIIEAYFDWVRHQDN